MEPDDTSITLQRVIQRLDDRLWEFEQSHRVWLDSPEWCGLVDAVVLCEGLE